MASVSYMSAASSDLFAATGPSGRYYSSSQFGVCQLHFSCQFSSLCCSAGSSGKFNSLSKNGVCQPHVSCQFRSLLRCSAGPSGTLNTVRCPNMASLSYSQQPVQISSSLFSRVFRYVLFFILIWRLSARYMSAARDLSV
jgi:hypothetical protein